MTRGAETRTVGVRLPVRMVADLYELARREDEGLSVILRRALREFVNGRLGSEQRHA
jgi:hypothetical protein